MAFRKGQPKKTNKYSSIGERYTDYQGERVAWNNLRYRCTNPSSSMYEDYGGRGIKVCDRWSGTDGFINFYNDMGKRPLDEEGRPYQIDRIDVNGDYCPENCRWVSISDNAKNKRCSIYVTIFGDKYCATDAARMFGLNRTTITESVRLGRCTADEAFARALERKYNVSI